MQRESETPLVAIRDMVNKLQAHTIPKGVRKEVELHASAEKQIELTSWVVPSAWLLEVEEPWWKNSVMCHKLYKCLFNTHFHKEGRSLFLIWILKLGHTGPYEKADVNPPNYFFSCIMIG